MNTATLRKCVRDTRHSKSDWKGAEQSSKWPWSANWNFPFPRTRRST
jgi:hypothetical protein